MSTYFIKSDYLDTSYLVNKLEDWKEYDNSGKIDFIYYDGDHRSNKELNKKIVTLKSVIDTKDTLTNKLRLYEILDKPLYMPLTYIDPNKVPFTKNSKYILRPVQGWSGKELYVVKTKDQLTKYLDIIRKTYKKEVLISEYIQDLMLYNQKIFHLRVYFVVSVINKKYKTYMVDYILTARAKEKYSKNKELNKNVYDSHLGKSSTDVIFPEDFTFLTPEQKTNITHQMKGILYLVSEKFKEYISCYTPDSKNCFELLGVDFMITNDLIVKLLEINTKVSFETHTEKVKNKLSQIIFDGIYSQFINPVFSNKKSKVKDWSEIYG